MLTPGATRQQEYAIYEPFYAPVERIRAEVGGRRLRGDDIREQLAESQDVFLSGGRYHVLRLPESPEVGEHVFYEYRRSYSDLVYAPLLYIPAGDRLDRYSIEIEHPENVTVAFDIAFTRDPVPYRVDESRRGHTRLVFEGLDPLADLPYFGFNGYHAVVHMAFRADDQPLNPVSADEFSSWYSEIANRSVGRADPVQLDAVAAPLQRDTPAETVAAVHDYVRSTIRYIADERGENAFVPRAPDVVLDRGYGDCKDRAFLVAAIAERLGIGVDIVLVSTEPEPSFEGTHVGLYNHVINAYQDSEDNYIYFDPTHRYMPFGSLPESDAEGPALHMTAAGARLIAVPAIVEEPEVDVQITASLDGEGMASIILRGDALARIRYWQDQGGGNDIQNALSTHLGQTFYKLRFSDFMAGTDAGSEAQFMATVDLSEFIIVSPTRRYVPVTALQGVPSGVLDRRDDAFDLHLPDRPNYRLVLDVEAPGWDIDAAEYQMGADDEPFLFTSNLTPSDGGARIEYRFTQRQKRFGGAARTAYLNAARSYLDARREVYIFNPMPVAETPGQ